MDDNFEMLKQAAMEVGLEEDEAEYEASMFISNVDWGSDEED